MQQTTVELSTHRRGVVSGNDEENKTDLHYTLLGVKQIRVLIAACVHSPIVGQ